MQPPPIEQDENVRITEASHGNTPSHITRGYIEAGAESRKDIADAAP